MGWDAWGDCAFFETAQALARRLLPAGVGDEAEAAEGAEAAPGRGRVSRLQHRESQPCPPWVPAVVLRVLVAQKRASNGKKSLQREGHILVGLLRCGWGLPPLTRLCRDSGRWSSPTTRTRSSCECLGWAAPL